MELFPPELFYMLLALGVAAGFLAGLLGIGGGVVLVPGLFSIFHLAGFDSGFLMHMAVGTSLAIIMPTGLSSAYAHWRKKAVDLETVKTIGPGIVTGAILGAILVDFLPDQTLTLIFAVIIALLAVIMAIDPARLTLKKALPPPPACTLAGAGIGGLSSLIGIGGATLSVPYMTMHGFTIHKAIGTASALGLLISVPASIGFMAAGWGEHNLLPMSLGYVNVPAALIVGVASIFFAPFGARVTHSLPVKTMRTGFAVFMAFVAVRMIIEVL